MNNVTPSHYALDKSMKFTENRSTHVAIYAKGFLPGQAENYFTELEFSETELT